MRRVSRVRVPSRPHLFFCLFPFFLFSFSFFCFFFFFQPLVWSVFLSFLISGPSAPPLREVRHLARGDQGLRPSMRLYAARSPVFLGLFGVGNPAYLRLLHYVPPGYPSTKKGPPLRAPTHARSPCTRSFCYCYKGTASTGYLDHSYF